MKWTLINQAGANDPDTGDIYSGLDRFGRVKDNRWIDGDGDDLDRIQYGYDRAGNRLWRHNVVAAALDKEFDEIYAYDGVHRLQDMARGTLNGGRTALTSETFAQCWTLDATGNWQGFREDDNGDGTWDLIQQRTANPVNEITDLSETAGPTWVTPAYSPAGNMTTMPKVADPAVAQTCQYDAWNRLTKVSEGANTVAEYQYDGAKRRIIQKSYTEGVLDETRHLYYTEPSKWQVIEERNGELSDAERQFVWGLRYIDDIVVRDRDTDDDGSLDERLYGCQDANWNVTAIVDDASAVQERYAYSGYGMPILLTAGFNASGSTTLYSDFLFAGYRWDASTFLFHARNRAYHSCLGSWLQRDQLGYADGPSLYGYCNSRPVSSLDPFGDSRIDCTCARLVCIEASGQLQCETEEFDVAFDCQRAAVARCCDWACGQNEWTGNWRIAGQRPDDPNCCSRSGCAQSCRDSQIHCEGLVFLACTFIFHPTFYPSLNAECVLAGITGCRTGQLACVLACQLCTNP